MLTRVCTILTLLTLAGCGAGIPEDPDDAAAVRSISREVLGGLAIGMLEPEARTVIERFGSPYCTTADSGLPTCSTKRERGAWPGYVRVDFEDGALVRASVILDEEAFARISPAAIAQRLSGGPRDLELVNYVHVAEWISPSMGAGVALACTTLTDGQVCMIVLAPWPLADDS